MIEVTFETETPELAAIIVSVLTELRRAEIKHPIWPGCHVKQIAFVSEESGELVRAGNLLDEGKGNFDEIRTEAIQTAATAIRFLKNLTETEKYYKEPHIIDFLTEDEDFGIRQEVDHD